MRHTQLVNVVPALDLPRQLDQTDCFHAGKEGKSSQYEESGNCANNNICTLIIILIITIM